MESLRFILDEIESSEIELDHATENESDNDLYISHDS